MSRDRLGERVLIETCLLEADGLELAQPWFLGSECDGGFAEYTVVAARHAYAIESALSDTELASFPCSYSTAENMLARSNTQASDRVLVTGASGGVGSAAVQLARARGATVVAVTGPAKAEALRSLGAEQTVARDDSLVDALGRDSIDVVIDLVAGPQWPELLDVLRAGGRYAVAGAIREHQASVVFLPFSEDAHPDHRATTRIVEDARFDAKLTKTALPGKPIYPKWLIYYYCTHLRHVANPAFCIDISEQIDTKIESILAYESQFVVPEKNRRVIDWLKQMNGYMGSRIGCAFAEPFFMKEPVGLTDLDSLVM